jgi:F-type H+-transporting ATPase subunit delta
VATDEPIVAGVAGRYASALFDLAREEGQQEAVERDLATFEGFLEASEDLVRVVRSPVIAADDQAAALGRLLGLVGASPLTQNFFNLLAKNRRMFAAPEMARAYRALAAKERGEVTAQVVSAHPLSEAQQAALKDTLAALVGKDVKLAAKVDPALLGGLVVKVGSRMVDSSLRTRLQSLTLALKGGA